jgi:hypothetical protein
MNVIDIPSVSVAASIVQIDEFAVGREQSTAEFSNGGDRMKMCPLIQSLIFYTLYFRGYIISFKYMPVKLFLVPEVLRYF